MKIEIIEVTWKIKNKDIIISNNNIPDIYKNHSWNIFIDSKQDIVKYKKIKIYL
jgi:hypothetical protein